MGGKIDIKNIICFQHFVFHKKNMRGRWWWWWINRRRECGKKNFLYFLKRNQTFFCNITQLPKHYIFWTKHKTNRAVQSTTFFKSFNFFDRFLIKIREVVCFRRTRWTQRKNRKILWNFNTSYVVAMPHDECKVTNNLQMSRISLLGLILRKTWVSTSFWCNFLFFF